MSSEFDFDRFCRTLVRQTSDAVIYADDSGVIRFWNAGAERIFGFSEAEATGKSLDIIIPEDLRQRHWSGFRQTLSSGRTRYSAGHTLGVRALRKDGRVISVEFSMLPFRDTDGAILGIAAILRDVHERVGVRGAHTDWMNL
jgi:PAS domain S-box-containing protein